MFNFYLDRFLTNTVPPFHCISCLDIHTVSRSKYVGESNENLKYFLSRNLLNTKGTQWLHFSTWSPLRTIQVFQHFGSAWIPLEKKYFGWERSHSCTACFRRTWKAGSHLLRSIIQRHSSPPRTTGFEELGTPCRPSDSYSSLDRYYLIIWYVYIYR